MNPHTLVRAAAAAVILALPTAALAAPDNNSNANQCVQWNNQGQCVRWSNGQWNNGQWNNGQYNNRQWQGQGRHRDRDDEDDNDRGNEGHHYGWNHGRGNPHRNGNYGGYGGYGNNNGNQTLSATVASFSPYNLYLTNGTHVALHDGTVINPTGTNLTGGQRVRIYGYWNGNTFNANEIDVVGNNWYQR